MKKDDEKEFIGLILKNKGLAEKWNANDSPPIEAFKQEYHFLLRAIRKYISQGYLLTRNSFLTECQDLPSPKERIKEEMIYNSCFIGGHNTNDYLALKDRINKKGLFNKLGDGINYISKAAKTQNKQDFKKAANSFKHILTRIIEGDLSEPVLSQYLEFPMDAMPDVFHPLIEAAAKSIICPKEYIAIPLLTSMAGTIGRTYELEVKAGYREPTVLWTVAVGKPGSAKSPAMKTAIQGVYTAQARYRAEYDEKIKQYENDIKVYKKDFKKWERNGIGYPPKEPQKPILKRNVVADTTVEAIAPIMKDNPRGIMLIRDELSGWVTSMNQYKGGKGGDVPFYLETWSCGPHNIDRKGHDPISIPNTYLTVCGTCQPDTFKGLLGKSRQDDGFSARLLPYYPEDVDGYWSEEEIDASLFIPINKLSDTFSKFQMTDNSWGGKEPNVLRFSKCGKDEFKLAMERHYNLRKENYFTGMLEACWAKMRSHIARFALVIHLIRYHSGETRNIQVDKQSVLMAERLGMYFLAHIEKIWSKAKTQNIKQERKSLYEKLQSWDKEITPRNLISSKFAASKKDAVIKLDEIEKEGKGKWISPNKKKFILVG